ncbi:hypothetical protein L1049_023244 [Liquidambar formosana]|uniref:Two-component response regulator n=1 Tax=Liquidambar formosana TaxID=63359 RepID=A0AAP0RFT6_LIQFO
MTVEDRRGRVIGEEATEDRFPVGMRVLAVDDDPICLRVLDGLLRKCQYHVITTNQAVKALKMLRENKNKFDLVISDVDMPDMDGFKLLELVGLEMDLPVIMLSAHSDTKLVMKGITHGACDYLLKPVRIEELKNIWQHVLRRKKSDSKDQNKSPNEDKARQGIGEGGQGTAVTGNADQNGKLNRKRKDQDEDEEEDSEEGLENDDPSSQKKPRVVWSVDLHRKFVAAVNQLGVEKAVPKKILDLMNVDGLTRENVASHLQKFRLYLKRISCVATQQANMVAALGGKDSSYMRMGSLDGLRDFHTLAGSGRLPNTALSSYPPGGMLGRLNTPAGLGLRGLTSSELIQPAQNSSSSINSLGNLQPAVFPANQNSSLFQRIPTSLELDQLQQSKGITRIGEFNSINDPTGFSVSSSFSDTRVTVGSSSNSLPNVPSNPLMLQGSTQHTRSRGGFGNQSSTSLNLEPFKIGVSSSSNFLDQGRCNENWQSAVQLSKFPSNTLPLGEPFNYNQLTPNNYSDNISSTGPSIQSNPIDFSSTSAVSAPLEDSRGDMQCQAGFIGNVVQNMNFPPKQRWEEHRQDYTHNLNNVFSTSLVPANGVVGSLSQSLDQNGTVCSRNTDVSVIGQLNGGTPSLLQHSEVEKLSMDPKMKSHEDYLSEHTQSQGSFIQNGYESLDDLMSAMIKREQNQSILMDGEFGFDAYSLGSCI